MALDFPDPHIIPPKSSHALTVIVVHGRGSTTPQFAEEFFLTESSQGVPLHEQFPSVKWVFPGARTRFSTAFQEDISEWYDIVSLGNPERGSGLQRPGLSESITHLRGIVDKETREWEGDKAGKIVLGGISMGLAVAIHVLLSLGGRREIAALFGWCGWLPLNQALNQVAAENVVDGLDRFYLDELQIGDDGCSDGGAEGWARLRQSVPVFLSHCADDVVVRVDLGRQLRDTLSRLGLQVSWREYEKGGHWIKEPGAVDELASFLQEMLAVSADPHAPLTDTAGYLSTSGK